MIFAGVMALFKASLPETFAPVILKRRATKLRKETGDPNICTEQEMFKVPFTEMMKDTLIRPFEMLFTEPILLLLSMYIALIYGLLVSLFDFHSTHALTVGVVRLLLQLPRCLRWQLRLERWSCWSHLHLCLDRSWTGTRRHAFRSEGLHASCRSKGWQSRA